MNFKEMIDAGAEALGNQGKLADKLGLSETNLAAAKNGRRGFKDRKCVALAEIIGASPFAVIAARNEWLADTQEEKNFWHRFCEAAAVAATVIGVTLFVSCPSEAIAGQGVQAPMTTGYTLLTLVRAIKRRMARAALAGKNWLTGPLRPHSLGW